MDQMTIEPAVLIDDRDCAFPKAVQLPDGTLLCSYGVGGGPEVWGGTDLALSRDGGQSWAHAGTVLNKATRGDIVVSNALKLSLSEDGKTVFAYGSRFYRQEGATFGQGEDEAVLCTSEDGGESWSKPRVLGFDREFPLEISDSLLTIPGKRMLAPAGLLPAEDRLGEKVVGLLSEDGGKTWPREVTVFEHPADEHGYFEHKFTVLPNGDLLGICWTVSLDTELVDQPNHAVISRDRGATWGEPVSTGIRGQTMCALPLDDDVLLVAYNRRYGRQGIVLAAVSPGESGWDVMSETLAYDAQANLNPGQAGRGVETFDAFRFGFPQLLRLADGAVLLTYWAQPAGATSFGVYSVRIHLH